MMMVLPMAGNCGRSTSVIMVYDFFESLACLASPYADSLNVNFQIINPSESALNQLMSKGQKFRAHVSRFIRKQLYRLNQKGKRLLVELSATLAFLTVTANPYASAEL